jgi:hypothetical protein
MKMRSTLVLLALLAMTATAMAVTAPPLPTPYVFLEMTDHSNGTVYAGDPGTYRRVNGVWLDENDAPAENVSLFRQTPEGAWDADEDTWGVLAWKILRPGITVDLGNDGSIEEMGAAPGGIPTYVWSQFPGAAGVGLVGMYYGGHDTEVLIRPDGSFVVHTEEVQFELHAVDSTLLFFDAAGTTATDHEGPKYEAGRRDTENTYGLWVDSTDATKIPLLRAVSEFFVADGRLIGDYFVGTNTSYYNLDGDPNVWVWNDLIQPDLFTDPDGNSADLWAKIDLLADSGYEWLTKSNDDGGFQAIPEPMTMGTLFAAVAGIGAYIKRRRKA